jgi:hypothetical protein
MIMPGDLNEVQQLRDILTAFSAPTGLQINYHKTSMVPINVDEELASNLAEPFGCKLESIPFKYMGLSLDTTRPSILDLMPMVSRLDKTLSGISSLMTHT